MTNFDWLSKGIILWFFVIYYLQIVGVDGHHYSCLTLNGNDGLCVVKRLCREAANQFLKPCEGENSVCCPIQPTYRLAQRPTGTTQTSTTKAPIPLDRPNQEVTYDRNSPRTTYSEDRSRTPRLPSSQPSVEPAKSKRGALPERESHSYSQGVSRSPSAVSISEQKVNEQESKFYETRPTKETFYNSPSGQRPRDVSEDEGKSRQNIPERRKESSSTPQSSGSSQKRPSILRDEKNVRVSDSQPQSVKPNRYPSDDGLERQLDPPRRQKPPTPAPQPHEISQPLPQVPACGVKPYDLFIAGGETSEEHEWPWMAAIFRRHMGSKPKTFQCGGSLINARYVLTAAHCFVINNVILPASSYVVRLGSHSLTSGEEFAVSNLVLHYNHSGSEYFNDIALIRLSSEVYITDKIAPICLPFREMSHENFVGKSAVVAGWGDTYFRSEGTRVLKHVSVPVVSNEECAAAYRRVRGAVFLARGSDHVMCAGLMEGGKDACQGDSGGPLMLKSQNDCWIVVGIVSLGYKCAEPGYPGVYTRVTHYMSWIQANMKSY